MGAQPAALGLSAALAGGARGADHPNRGCRSPGRGIGRSPSCCRHPGCVPADRAPRSSRRPRGPAGGGLARCDARARRPERRDRVLRRPADRADRARDRPLLGRARRARHRAPLPARRAARPGAADGRGAAHDRGRAARRLRRRRRADRLVRARAAPRGRPARGAGDARPADGAPERPRVRAGARPADRDGRAVHARPRRHGRPEAATDDRDGHTAGNEALQRLARSLAAAVRSDDDVARIGGDEFSIVAAGTGAHAAAALTARLGRDLEQAGIPASFGWAVFPDDGADAASLFRCADARLYDGKRLRARIPARQAV
ncbi:MAG: GGDEF domain-containing protein [Thermoleophilia bacterium]